MILVTQPRINAGEAEDIPVLLRGNRLEFFEHLECSASFARPERVTRQLVTLAPGLHILPTGGYCAPHPRAFSRWNFFALRASKAYAKS